jgi:molecular chaperone GrpE
MRGRVGRLSEVLRMSADESARDAPEQTAVLPETAAQLVELERLQQALSQAEERAKANWDQYLRAVADLENIRKRAERDVQAANRYGLEKFAGELIPVLDSLELAVQTGEKADARTLVEGQKATLRLLTRAFEKLGITELDPKGEKFDPNRHEAMMVQESPNAAPDSVIQVVQRGYELNGRVLRPARVIVAK